MVKIKIFLCKNSIAESPGLVQPPIVIRSRYELSRIVTGLLPNKKYRFTVLATTFKGASLDPNFVEVVTSSAESKTRFEPPFFRLLDVCFLFNTNRFSTEPSKTNFIVVSTYEDGFNLTWSTADQSNAASLFYVKYKKTGWFFSKFN